MPRGGRRGGGMKRKHSNRNNNTLTKKQKSHYKQFGEEHPADERSQEKERFKKFKEEKEKGLQNLKPESSSSSEEEDGDVTESAFHQLVSAFGKADNSSASSESEEESNEESETSDDSSENNHVEGVLKKKAVAEENIQAENESASDEYDSDNASSDQDEETKEQSGGEDEVVSDEEESDTLSSTSNDPFKEHFETDISEEFAESLKNVNSWDKRQIKFPHVGQTVSSWPKLGREVECNVTEKDITKMHVKPSLSKLVRPTNINAAKVTIKDQDSLTPFQLQLFSCVNKYQDIYYPERNANNSEEIRVVYCLHAVNHILKTRSRIIGHNAKIKSKYQELDDEFRDQGLTRPKVLIVLPFRDAALRTVRLISRLLFEKDKMNVQHKYKFKREYSEEKSVPKGKKPDDFEATFDGNTDDNFCMGLGLSKKSLKLYCDIYSSDIILSSPLALRTMTGADGEEGQDHDFLSSIEVLVIDQADIFMMQNWDHVMHLMEYLHRQPAKSHGVDFSRVRMWTLNGWSKFYRQTLLFTQIVSPEINSLFNKQCNNYHGKIQVLKDNTSGSICQIVAQLPQMFHRLSGSTLSDIPDARFEFFKSRVLPQYKESVMSHTLIVIPSYFDYVRLRNYLKKEEYSVQHICEYTNKQHLSRARSFFFHGKTHFLLYTERLHFYHRYKIRGIRHIIFYDLPTYPHFYSELCNMVDGAQDGADSGAMASTCTVLYSKFEAQKLGAIVGTDRARHMLHAEKSVHMFVTGDS